MKDSKLPNARPSAGSSFVRLIREGAVPAVRLLARPRTLLQIPRLLREGLGPVQRMLIQAHNNRELARLAREQAPVTILSSFARSGSTWMCYLLGDVLLQNQGIETATELPIDPDTIIVHYYAKLIVRRDPSVRTPGLMIRTHDLIPQVQAHVGGDAAVRKWRYLYLYRTPEDAVVSTFHLYQREKHLHSKFSHDIDLFCLDALAGWIEHVKSFLDALDEGVEVHLVSYDELLRQTTVVLSETLRWLGIPHTEAMVARAHSNMLFAKLQAREAKALGGQTPSSGGGYEKGFPYETQLRPGKVPFFRRGREGSGGMELKPETLAKIREATQHLFARANASLARQSSRRQAIEEEPPPDFLAEPVSRNGHAEFMPASNGR
jgi:hypothetical protein